MRKFTIIFWSIFILFGCKTELKDEIVELHPNGKVKKVHYYTMKRGQKNVVKEIVYYPSGEKFMEGAMKKDQRNGTWISWYKNGNRWSQGTYSEGIRTDSIKAYYENGEIRLKGIYENGKRAGIWYFYDEEGRLIQQVEFKEDSIFDQEEFFYGIPFK